MRPLTGAMRHASGAMAEALLFAAIVAALALALGPVYAPAKLVAGGGIADAGRAGGNTITIVGMSGASRVAATYGSDVTTYSTLARDYYLVYVRVTCSQDGAGVYESWRNIKTGTWDTSGYATFSLSSSSWTGGAADCTADLLNATMKGNRRVYSVLASTDFAVAR